MATQTDLPMPRATNATNPQRLVSLDALRGFDMFWILGADALCQALGQMSQSGPTRLLAYELDHADWAGFHFYDLIFPLFVFIVGVSAVFSLGRTLEKEGRGAAIKRILRRTALLYLCALVYYGGLRHVWPDIRLVGVLDRIALAYCGAGLAFCFLKTRGLVAAGAGLLIGYWALMSFVPFPDVRPTPGGTLEICKETGFTNTAQLNFSSTNTLQGVFIKGVNLANYVDQKYLPGMKWDGTWDPEGILSTLPAMGTCLLGILAGLLLRNASIPDARKVRWLIASGLAAIALGWLWSLQFPVIKKI
jgi:predicted acyltransferase